MSSARRGPRLPARLPFFIAILFALCSHSASGQDADPQRFVRWMFEDGRSLVQASHSSAALYAVGGALLLSPVSLLDRPVSNDLTARYRSSRPLNGYLGVVNELGGKHMSFVSAGVFGISLLTDDQRFQDAAFTSMESLFYAGLISYGLKYSVGRVRPEDTASAFRFDPFSGSTSFPSGHATAAFAVLTPWAIYYPHPVTYGLVVVGAGGTALARISMDKHWPTDVIAGSAIGFITAYHLSRRHRGSGRSAGAALNADVSVVPSPVEGAPFLVSLRLTF